MGGVVNFIGRCWERQHLPVQYRSLEITDTLDAWNEFSVMDNEYSWIRVEVEGNTVRGFGPHWYWPLLMIHLSGFLFVVVAPLVALLMTFGPRRYQNGNSCLDRDYCPYLMFQEFLDSRSSRNNYLGDNPRTRLKGQ